MPYLLNQPNQPNPAKKEHLAQIEGNFLPKVSLALIEHFNDAVDDDDHDDDNVDDDDDDVADYPAMSWVSGLFTQQAVVTTNVRKTIIFNPD